MLFTSVTGAILRPYQFRRRHFHEAVERSGLAPLRPHDLRHSAISLWIASGANPKVVQAKAGHASIKVTYDRYGHLWIVAGVLPGLQRRRPAPLPPYVREGVVSMAKMTSGGDDPELAQLRRDLDEADERLLAALAARMGLVRRIGDYKGTRGLPAWDPAREQAVVASIEKEAARLDLDPLLCRRIYALVLDESRAIQASIHERTTDSHRAAPRVDSVDES